MLFIGNIEAKIDTKARAFVPAVFRKILQNNDESTLILRKDIFQNCLVLYPTQVWEKELTDLRAHLNRWDRREQALFRQFVVDAEKVEIDANGRILIPKRYLQMADIADEVRFIGVDNTIEIWAKDVLEQTLLAADDFSASIEGLMSNSVEDSK